MMDREVIRFPATLRRYQWIALAAGVIALSVCGVGAAGSPAQFFRSYLTAFVFWTVLALGSLGILMMQYLTGGTWGVIIRRELESATRTLPMMALLFLPIVFGMRHLYVWTHPDILAADEVLREKRGYLNIPFFLIRTAGYFLVWAGTAYCLNRWSQSQDRTGDPVFSFRLQRLSGPGLFALAVTVTFAMIDWVMSLEPHWYSTIYGVIFLAGAGLGAFAFAIAVTVWLGRTPSFAGLLLPGHYQDLGNLLLAFVMLWAYCAFSQFLLIWSGNLREEIPWYVRRIHGGWGWVAVLLIAIHFFIPFVLLFSQNVKRHSQRLVIVAAIVFLMRFVDVVWLIEPAFDEGKLHFSWMDPLALIGVGGLWLAVFLQQINARPLLPINDPSFQEAFAHGGE